MSTLFKTHTVVLGSILTLTLTATAHSQGMPDEVRERLGKLVGVWDESFSIGEESGTGSVSASALPNGEGIQYHYHNARSVLNGQPIFATGLIGWDAAKQLATERQYANNGAMFTSTFTLNAEGGFTSPIRGSVVDQAGKVSARKDERSISFPDENTFEVRGTSQIGDDPVKLLKATYRRVSEDELERRASQEYQAFDSYFTGQWDVKRTNSDDSVIDGEFMIARASMDGTHIVSFAAQEGLKTTSLWAYDRTTGRWTGHWVDNAGHASVESWEPLLGRKIEPGSELHGVEFGFQGGQPLQLKLVLRVIDAKTYEVVVNNIHDPTDSYTSRMTRRDNADLSADAKPFMSRLVGTWTMHGQRNGEPFTGLYQVRWNDAHTGLILSSREGNKLTHGVGFWDATTGELVETWIVDNLSVVLRVKPSADLANGYGRVTLHLPSGEVAQGTSRSEHFSSDKFKFIGKVADGRSFEADYTRVPIGASEAALANYGKFVVGGTWVCETQTPTARHTYTWRSGNKTLAWDRQGGRFPGVSLLSVDHVSQCLRSMDVDDDGTTGSSVWVQTDENTWLFAGRFAAPNEEQDLYLTLTRTSPDEIHLTGTAIFDGQEQSVSDLWKRTR